MPPLRYFAPNAVTALSLLFGLGSVAMAVEGNFHLAAWFILWGALLDKMDGGVARLLKATSSFGVEFDSFADFVAFGIAPAALVYYRVLAANHLLGWSKHVLMAAAGAYVLALGVRLARFNVTTSADDTVFLGFPGTLLGGIIASTYLTWEKYSGADRSLAYSPVLLLVGALLMVSSVRLPKVKARKNKLVNAFQFANVAAGFVFAPLMIFPEYLLGVSLLFTSVGVVWCLLHPQGSAPAAKVSEPPPVSEPAPDSEASAEVEPSEELA